MSGVADGTRGKYVPSKVINLVTTHFKHSVNAHITHTTQTDGHDVGEQQGYSMS